MIHIQAHNQKEQLLTCIPLYRFLFTNLTYIPMIIHNHNATNIDSHKPCIPYPFISLISTLMNNLLTS